jgi:hypothetical protein
MAELRTACLEDLVERLRQDLGDGGLLADRFELAFAHRDAELVAEAMEDIGRLPRHMQEAVHDAILEWLFSGDPAAGLRTMPVASMLPQ